MIDWFSSIPNARYAPSEMARQVIATGWLQVSIGERCDPAKIADMARSLGNAMPGRRGEAMEELTPLIQRAAAPKSLSAIHGMSSFPLHTDGAHLAEPPRFIVLACADPGLSPVPTVLVRFQDLEIGSHAGNYLVRNGRKSFYSSVCDGARPFVRFDQGCMEAIDNDARHLTNAIIRRGAGKLTAIHWRAGDVLVIDNWRVLHGRGLAKTAASPTRLMLRVSVR